MKSKKTVLSLDVLDLNSDSTTATPSQAQTSDERTIYFNERKIEKGVFDEVSRSIRARDENYVTVKRFILSVNKRKRDEIDSRWREKIRREFAIMRDNLMSVCCDCSILIMTLTIEQLNVMRVIEFRKTPEPFIVMDYYELDNIMKADVNYDQYVTAVGQILDDLGHLHERGVAHRDLKPENLLIEKAPFFKVVITDFGLFRLYQTLLFSALSAGRSNILRQRFFPVSVMVIDLQLIFGR
jgi:serine/threonine protein kinase